jgi:hypothetical protein
MVPSLIEERAKDASVRERRARHIRINVLYYLHNHGKMGDSAPFLTPGVYQQGQFNDRVVFCTGGAGSICSAQVKALVYLGADACIVGRNEEKTLKMAKEIASVREGAKCLGIGKVDVRSIESLEDAVTKCVAELGSLDYLM